jgi:hypothetical protein
MESQSPRRNNNDVYDIDALAKPSVDYDKIESDYDDYLINK